MKRRKCYGEVVNVIKLNKIRTMKKILSAIVLLSAAVSVYADDAKEEKNDSTGGFVFTDVKVLKTTPVKDQNKSGTCWCFAGTSFFEDEIMRKGGKELDLSEMYTVRQCYLDKAENYVRMNGATNFAPAVRCSMCPTCGNVTARCPKACIRDWNTARRNMCTASLTLC